MKNAIVTIPVVNIDQSPLQEKLDNLGFVDLKPVRNTKLEPLYNSLIQQHHYLGYRQIVGNHLKYIAFIDDRPVACLGWGSAAWKTQIQRHLHWLGCKDQKR